jgi:hypothetical protein
MLRKTCILLSLLAALTAARLPLGFVQLGSWSGMFLDYVEQTGSVPVSLAWTFDGEHRCGGCVYVSEATAKAEEQEKLAMLDSSFSKIPFALLDLQFVVVEPSKVSGDLSVELHLLPLSVPETAVPPPRIS